MSLVRINRSQYLKFFFIFSIILGSFLLVGIGRASAATYYVKADATGNGDGSDWTNATTTIQAGINAANNGDTVQVWTGTYSENVVFNASQNGKALTVTGGNGGEVIITKSSGYVLSIQSSHTSGEITFNSITIVGTGTVAYQIGMAGTATLAFNNCTIGGLSDVGSLMLINIGSAGSVSFTECTIIHNNSSYAIGLFSNPSLSISGGSITTGTGHFIQINANSGAITLDTITMTTTGITTGNAIIYTSAGSYSTGAITIRNCTLTTGAAGGFKIDRGAASVSITGNTITNTASSGATTGIAVGADGTTAYSPKIGTATVMGNTVIFSGTSRSHGILIGRGVTAGNIFNNSITGPDYGIVVKSDNVSVNNNIILGPSSGGLGGVYLRGGKGNIIENNSFYVTQGYGILLDTQDGASSENTNTTWPGGNGSSVASGVHVSDVGEGGSITLLAVGSQPPVRFRPRITLYNLTAGALNLYEGITTFAVTGTYEGSPVSENITFTSTVGNKAVAASKARYKTGVNYYDQITQVIITNIPDGNFYVYVGTAGTAPIENNIKNNIVVLKNGNVSSLIYDGTGTSDGNAKNNDFDYNSYQTGGGNLASLNYGGSPPTNLANLADLRAGWTVYSVSYLDNDISSMVVDPELTDKENGNFSLLPTSPAIDSGTSTGLTTDYSGNSIYGAPDIGAYEYQPPYTFAVNDIPTTGSVRLYSDGKYRALTATSSSATGTFSVQPVGGFYSASTSQYMDITIDSWLTSGTKNKQWTATSSTAAFNTNATSTVYTIGDLVPNARYQFTLDSTPSTALTGATCSGSFCTADSSGSLTFTYTGGYSTHTFALTKTASGGTQQGTLTVSSIVINNNGGTKNDFPLFVNGAQVTSGIATSFLAPANAYTVSATSDSNYTQSFSGSCDTTGRIALSPGDYKTCTVTFDDIAPAVVSSSSSAPAVSAPAVSSTSTPVVPATSLSGLTSEQVSSILTVLASFGLGADTMAKVQAALSGQTVISTQISTSSFTRDLQLHQTGNDVKQLQQFLNAHGFTLATTGPGSPSNETTYFGTATYTALVQFQKANNITPTSGYFGPLTRAKIAEL